MRKSILIALLSLCSQAMAEPKVAVSVNSFDFGRTIQQSTLTHHFWIKSVGSDTLKIIRIEPGCGCTQMPLEDSTIAPGDSTRLGIIFKTGRFNGLVAKAPSFRTNASVENQVLKIYADILVDTLQSQPLTIHPASVDVSQFSEKARRRTKFTIKNLSERDYNIKVVDSAFKSFTVEAPRTVTGNGSTEGTIIVNKDKIEGGFAESFTIEIDDENRTRFTIPVVRIYKPTPTPAGAIGAK